jgi:hypothetical protein
MSYSLNDTQYCTINSLDLFSIERTRKSNVKLDSDTTVFASDDSDLFVEKEWKGMLEPIPFGPQAVSLDVGFNFADSIYGIPERINSFKVKNTVEYKSSESGSL